MSVKIYGFPRPSRNHIGCSSINIGDPNLKLISKTEIYKQLFRVSHENLPHISWIYEHGTNINSDTITYVENFKPDIFIIHGSGSVNVLEHLKHRPKIIIIQNACSVICNGENIPLQFNDINETFINRIIVNYHKGGQINGKYVVIENRSDCEKLFYSEGLFLCDAVNGCIKRLILEYLTQYKDNPTIKATPRDEKAELLELVSTMRNQLNELEQRIKNM